MFVHEPRYFIVEGNIGAGKSTFLRVLKEYLDVHVVPEPIHKWQNIGGHNLLEKFYVETHRWAYSFQTYAFVSRVIEQAEHARKHPNAIHIVERSVFSDRYCFAYNAYEQGFMTDLEWKLYQEWFDWLVCNYLPKPAGIIYLQANPNTCNTRNHIRNRSEDVGVSIDYLQQLHAKHEQWLIHKEGIAENLRAIPVLTIPCNSDFVKNEEIQQNHMNCVAAFVTQHTGKTIALEHELKQVRV